MESILKIGSLVSLLAISYQDMKQRKVSLYLFFLSLAFTSLVYFVQESTIEFLGNVAINFILVLTILGVLFSYSWFKLKQLLFEVFGLGDALFFMVLACSFPTPTFIILFISSLLFSLLIFLILKPKLKDSTVPLAGLQALFVVLVFCLNWLFNFVNIYR